MTTRQLREQWREGDGRLGEVNGLPTINGRVVAQNDVGEFVVERLDGKRFIAHRDWFVVHADKNPSVKDDETPSQRRRAKRIAKLEEEMRKVLA